MFVRGDSLWIAENTGSVLVIDLNVCQSSFVSHEMELIVTSLDEQDNLNVQMSPGTNLGLRLRGQNSRVWGWQDHDYRFMG
jgi:hypothetical protein